MKNSPKLFLLLFFIGERITLKDNNLVYSPGNSQESSLLSLTDNSKEIQNDAVKIIIITEVLDLYIRYNCIYFFFVKYRILKTERNRK